jgi:hypothetical protein
LGIKQLTVSLPKLGVAPALPLFHDFLQCRESGGETVNRDEAPATIVEVLVGDLPGRIATEDIRLAKGF